ncbi:MAG: ABC transporter ATP-binding protein [Bdellovibrio sp.]|nr:MAG: ABC transporter ATP-binding protein [Bdellovibrio sp.]
MRLASVIEVRRFKKRFGSKEVHRGVSFHVEQGECLGLIGGSGSGKSVLLRSLIGLEKADSGSIVIEGQDITQMTERELIGIRKKVAYAFQGGALFDSMTVFDNLAYPLREHTDLKESDIKKKIRDLLFEFGLADSENLFPGSLSGGMQKRVGLARAIILNPDTILYDEPTAGLDPFNTRKISEMILRLKAKKKTGILVTHDMPVAFEVCDRIALLVHGNLDIIAKPKEIQQDALHPISIFAHGDIT